MREHLVPQQISSYEFRLIGDMTIKQFFQVAGGVVVALIFYSLPIPGFIKWPCAVFFACLGAALAFLPINDRPLSVWLFAFFKAIYSPTRYVWVKNGAEDIFSKNTQELVVVSTQGEERAKEYLNTVPQADANPAFDEAEKNFLTNITHLFQTHPSTPITNTQNVPVAITQPLQPVDSSQINIPVTPVQNVLVAMEQPRLPAGVTQLNPVQPVNAVMVPSVSSPTANATIQENNFVRVVPVTPIKVAGDAKFTVAQDDAVGFIKPNIVAQTYTPQNVTPLGTEQNSTVSTAVSATFATEASPPSPATIQNTIVGQVVDSTNKVVESAILEIRDAAGRPVRALRSNKVGHFITVTPLKNGDYEIETDKAGFTFDVIKFSAEGEIIPPILIKAK